MKKIIYILLLMIGVNTSIRAQSSVDTIELIKQELRDYTSKLKSSNISTGILADRTINIIPMEQFDGDHDSIDSRSMIEYVHNKINEMSINSNSMKSMDSIHKWAESYDVQGVNPVIIYNYKYNYIKKDALANKLLDTANGFLYDVAGNQTSPYEEGRIFMATPMYITMGSDSNVSFYFGKEFFLTNDTSSMSQVQVDFGDGNGPQTITVGSIYTVNYPGAGVFWGDIKVYDPNNGKTYHSRLQISVSGSLPNAGVKASYADITAKIPFQGKYGEGLFVYSFGSGNDKGCFVKPLIFVEGIDFGTKDRPARTTNRPCINGKCGYLGYIDVATGWENGIVGGKDEYGNETRRKEFELGPMLMEKLYKEGYDVIYLDFKDGATYMQENTMVLVELINYVNNKKCSKEELVVLGASMGGQLVRYALSYMEKNNMKHCVRNSIYFDSPHKGANIPIAMQFFMKYFTEHNTDGIFKDAKDSYENKLTRPAALQLLNNCPDGQYYGPHSLRLDFMKNLVNDLGSFPTRIRKVAISNGSGFGYGNGVKSGALLADMKLPYTLQWIANGYTKQDNLVKDIFVGFGRTLFIFNAAVYNGGAIRSEMYTTSSSIGTYTIFMGDANKRGNKLEVGWDGENRPSYDDCPGGLNDAVEALDVMTRISKRLFVKSPQAYFKATCFIPVNSGLALYTDDINKSAQSVIGFGANMDHPNRSVYPFDAYSVPCTNDESDNQRHVQMTKNNIDWLIKELRRTANQLSKLPLDVKYYDADDKQYTKYATTYNFGTDFRNTLNDVSVNQDGVLQVNKNDYMYYKLSGDDWNNMNENNFTGKVFDLYTANCGSEVEINKGGQFMIGDNNAPINNKAIVHIEDGSTLYLNAGSKLYIYWGSKLIIEKGATLYIEPGAEIYIEDQACIDIRGKLTLSSNAILKPGGSGRVIFNNRNATFSISAASGSIIEMNSTKGETKLEVAGAISIPQQLSAFKIIGSIVEANEDASIGISSAVYLRDAIFKTTSNNIKNSWVGLKFANQADNDLYINYCKFYNAKLAVDLSNSYNLTSPSFYRDEFYSNSTGISIVDAAITLNSCIFQDNSNGLSADWITGSSVIQGCKFKDNAVRGIEYWGNTNGMLLFKNNQVIYSDIMITAPSSNPFMVTIGCNKFSNSNLDIYYSNVNMSSNTAHNNGNNSDFGGYNVFSESPLTITKLFYLNLKDGYNDFSKASGYYIIGSVSNANTSYSNTQSSANYFNRINGGNYALPYGVPSNITSGKLGIIYVNPATQVTSNYTLYGNLRSQMTGGCQAAGAGGFAPNVNPLSQTTATEIKLYPNPVHNQLYIEFPISEDVTEIYIYDVQGKEIIRQKVSAELSQTIIYVDELKQGIYMAVVKHTGRSETFKFVKD